MSYLKFAQLHMLDSAKRGMIYGLIGFLCFSLNDVLIKKVTTTLHYHPIFIIFISSCVVMAVLLLIAKPLGGWQATFKTKRPKLHLARAILMLPAGPLVIYAFAHMPLSTGYAVIMLTPLFVTLLARFWMGEHHSKAVYALIMVGFIGVIVSLRPGHTDFSLPLLALFCGVLFSALRVSLLRRGNNKETALSMTFYPCLALIIVYAVPAYLYAPHITLIAFMTIIGAGICLAGGFVFTQAAYRIAPAAYAGITHYSQIIWGIVFGWLFFGTHPDVMSILGAFIIIGSGMALVWQTRSHKPSLSAASHPILSVSIPSAPAHSVAA